MCIALTTNYQNLKNGNDVTENEFNEIIFSLINDCGIDKAKTTTLN